MNATAKHVSTGVRRTVGDVNKVENPEQTFGLEDVKNEQSFAFENVKNDQSLGLEDVKNEQSLGLEDVKNEQSFVFEDVKNDQSLGLEDVKIEQSPPQTFTQKCQSIAKTLSESLLVSGSIVIASIALAVQVIPSSQREFASFSQMAYLNALGWIFYPFMFHSMLLLSFRTPAGRKFRQKYQLQKFEAFDVCVKFVSALQAFMASVFAWMVKLEDRCCVEDKFSAYSRWIDFYTWFGLPYFAYDMVVMYKAYTMEHGPMSILTFLRRNKIIFLHHLYIPTMGLYGVTALRHQFGDCVFMFLYSMEFSTIFVNVRLILHRLRMKSSPLYFVNGLAMLVSFFVCRIYLIPYLVVKYADLFGLTLAQAWRSLPLVSKVSACLFMSLQVYWMALMLRVAFRLLRDKLIG